MTIFGFRHQATTVRKQRTVKNQKIVRGTIMRKKLKIKNFLFLYQTIGNLIAKTKKIFLSRFELFLAHKKLLRLKNCQGSL